MKSCQDLQKQIPEWLLGELGAEAALELEEHIAGCPACSLEQAALKSTFGRMKQLEDVPVPRHFLVYPEEKRANPWQAFLGMSPSWRALAAAATVMLGFAGVMALAGLNIRAEKGALLISFGTRPAQNAQPAAPDTAALEARILKAVEDKSRQEAGEWVKALRSELTATQARLTREQRDSLLGALAAVETRLGGRLQDAARTLEERNDRNLSALYDTVSLERQRDVTAVDARIARLALASEERINQTDAILDALLQAADVRTK